MKSFATAILAIAALCCAGPALAQDGIYSGVSFGSLSYDQDGLPTVKLQALAFKAGRELTRNFAVEVRAGFGVGDDTVSIAGTPVEFTLDHYFGVYGKGILPVSEYFAFYGVLGVAAGKVTAQGFGYSASSSDTAVSFGLGFDLAFSQHHVLYFEWAELFYGSDYEVDAASLGYVYRY
jgi:hypothetical protein